MNSRSTVQWAYPTGRETTNIDNDTSRVWGDYKDNEISLKWPKQLSKLSVERKKIAFFLFLDVWLKKKRKRKERVKILWQDNNRQGMISLLT